MTVNVIQRVKAATTSQATTLTATLPGAATVGATQIALITTTSGSSGITMPAGWTQRATNTTMSANCFVYDRAVTATNQTSLALTLPSGGAVIYLLEVGGLLGYDVSAATNGGGPSASFSSGSVTPTTADSYLLGFVAYDTNTAMTFSSPLAEVDEHHLAGATSALFHNGYGEGVVAGTTARSYTVTPAASASGWETLLVAYKATSPVVVQSGALVAAADASMSIGGAVTPLWTGDLVADVAAGMSLGGVVTPIRSGGLVLGALGGLAVAGSKASSAGLSAGAPAAMALAGTRSQLGSLVLPADPILTLAGLRSQLATLAASAAASMALQSMPQGALLAAAVAALTVGGRKDLSAVLAARGTPVLLVSATTINDEVLQVRGTPALTVGQLVTHPYALAVRGIPALVVAGVVTRSAVLAMRAVPVLVLADAAVVGQIIITRQVIAVVLEGGGLAELLVNRGAVELLGNGRGLAVIRRGI